MYPGAHAKTSPDKPAYIMAATGQIVTYRQLDQASNRGAHLFRRLGLRTGDTIAIFMENNAHFLEVCWAAQRSGLIYTPISSRLTAPEVEYIVKDCGAKVLLTSRAKADVAVDLIEPLSHLRARLMIGGAQAGYDSYDDAIAQEPPEPIEDEIEGGDMLYSSGTTGRPKGVKLPIDHAPIGTPPALMALLEGLYHADENAVYLSPAPLYHAAPLRFNIAMHRIGATCVVMENFDALMPCAASRRIASPTANGCRPCSCAC